MNTLTRFSHTLIISFGLLSLLAGWSALTPVFAQHNSDTTIDNIPEFNDSDVEDVSWIKETIWAMQWLYLPESREQVKPLYGYRLSDIKENCKNSEVSSLSITDPVIILDSSNRNSDTLKLNRYGSSDKIESTLLENICDSLESKNRGDNNSYLVTDTFIPGIEAPRRYMVDRLPAFAAN